MIAPTRYRGSTSRKAADRAANVLGRLRWRALTRGGAVSGPSPVLGAGAAITLRGGTITAGTNVVVRADATFAVEGKLDIGQDVFMGRGALISCFHRVEIGDGVRFGERVSIHDENHVFEPISAVTERKTEYTVAPVSLGSGVWLGANVVVLPGVTIGEDTVVGAGSVVTADLPAGVLAAGVPARVLRHLER